MAYFFRYDKGQHKHRIYAISRTDRNGQFSGYSAIVERFDKDKFGVVENISLQFVAFRGVRFPDEKACRTWAIEFFENLKKPFSDQEYYDNFKPGDKIKFKTKKGGEKLFEVRVEYDKRFPGDKRVIPENCWIEGRIFDYDRALRESPELPHFMDFTYFEFIDEIY